MASLRRTGLAAILAGALIFAGQAGELVFGSPSDAVVGAYVALAAVGIVALGVAFWGFRTILRELRSGRIGSWLGLAGAALLAAFAVQAAIEVARTGDVPDNFLLFGLGLLLLFAAHILLAFALRRLPLGAGWMLSPLAAAGVVLALATEADPFHDIGLFLFEGAWLALGAVLVRDARGEGRLAREGTARRA